MQRLIFNRCRNSQAVLDRCSHIATGRKGIAVSHGLLILIILCAGSKRATMQHHDRRAVLFFITLRLIKVHMQIDFRQVSFVII